MSSDKAGLAASSGPVRVDVYLDFLCPECRRTEQVIGAELRTLEQEGRAAVVYHPVAFLDDHSAPRGYSTRGAAAAACAADLARFEQYAAVLFRRQPVERGPGLGTDALLLAGREAGITSDTFERCVRDGRYVQWVAYVSETAAAHQVTVTPTVLVDGRRLDVTGADAAAALADAVQEARR